MCTTHTLSDGFFKYKIICSKNFKAPLTLLGLDVSVILRPQGLGTLYVILEMCYFSPVTTIDILFISRKSRFHPLNTDI